MKHLFFLCLSFFIAICSSSQNNGSVLNKANVFTSPANFRSDVKSNGNIHLNYLNTANTAGDISLINGSFEFNTGQCIINGDNDVITANVAATTAYGCADEIDLMSGYCGFGTPKSGLYFLCLANGSRHCGDACNLELTGNLIPGSTYTISYFDRGYDEGTCCPPGVALEVGVSTKPDKQGTIVYTSPQPTVNVWSQRTFSFVAPNDGKYISFHAKDSAGRWTHIDSVTITSGCSAPYNLRVRNVTSTSAELTWDLPSQPVNLLKIIGREKATETIIRKQLENTDTRAVVKDLSPGTSYEWGMKGVCEDEKSIGVRGPDFTTLPLAPLIGNIKIFPNPVSDQLQIDGLPANQKTKLTIVDFLGNVRLVAFATAKSYSWNISTLQAGSYVLRIESNGGTMSRWFVKK